MSGRTPRFQLTTFDSDTDQRDADGYKFSDADRVLLDRLLTLATERHHHTGAAGTTTLPAAPTVTVAASGGLIAPNATYWYRYGLVDPLGQEHQASQPVPIRTPVQVATPGAPAVARVAGALQPGEYAYAVSATTGSLGQETLMSDATALAPSSPPAGYAVADAGFAITMPSLPSGAVEFKLYRKGPTDPEFYYLATVAQGQTYTDLGDVVPDDNVRAPTANMTNTANSVTVAVENETVELGWSVRFYRSASQSAWANTLIAWIAQTQADYDNGDPPTIVDAGHPPRPGTPVAFGAGVGSPPKVVLTDNTDIQGAPPPALITSPTQLLFVVPGIVPLGRSPWIWICEYDEVALISIRASLGRGASLGPGEEVSAQIECLRADADEWEDVGPVVVVAGDDASPVGAEVTLGVPVFLVQGDALGLRILTQGSGTDFDLVINMMLHVRHGSATESYEWGA